MIYEIAIQAFDYPDPDRAKAGDIIVVRPAVGVIGKEEQTGIIWITVDVTNPVVLEGLMEFPTDVQGRVIAGSWRKFAIPLLRLKQLNASFDLKRAADPRDAYQPFVQIDGTRMTVKEHIPYDQTVIDKETGVVRRG